MTRLPLCASCRHRHPYGVHGIEAFTAVEQPIPERRWWRR